MTDAELKQACLDLSKSAVALFDCIDEHGATGPLDSASGVMTLVDASKAFEILRGYYHRRNLQRMLALGIGPEQLARMQMGQS